MPEKSPTSGPEFREKVVNDLRVLSDRVIEEYNLKLNDVHMYALQVDLGVFGSAESFVQQAQLAINLGLSGVVIERMPDFGTADEDDWEAIVHQKVLVIWNPAEFKFD